MYKRTIFSLAMLIAAGPAYTQEPESPWSGKVSFGYLATSGNTENSNLNSAFEVAYTPVQWAHRLKGLAIYASENNATTSEAYELGWKSERNFSEKNFLFGRLDWRKDRFSTYLKQFSQTVGYGRRLITGEIHNLNVEVGVGARQSDLAIGTSESETIFRGGLNYAWALSETAEFTQILAVEAGDKNTYLESKTAVSAKLVGNLALVASYTVKHNTDVLPLTEETDTYTALSLEYQF